MIQGWEEDTPEQIAEDAATAEWFREAQIASICADNSMTDTEYELAEAKAELARHHVDFERISRAVRVALHGKHENPELEYSSALHIIEMIVG